MALVLLAVAMYAAPPPKRLAAAGAAAASVTGAVVRTNTRTHAKVAREEQVLEMLSARSSRESADGDVQRETLDEGRAPA